MKNQFQLFETGLGTARKRASNNSWRSRGLCLWCGGARTDAAYKICKPCREKRKQVKLERLAVGLCKCGSYPVKQGKKSCTRCLETYRRSRLRDISLGLCGNCRKPRERLRLSSCDKCAVRSRGWKNKQADAAWRKRFGKDLKFGKGATERFNKMVEEQKGKCAICGRVPSSIGQHHLHLDHDHETGQNRAPICFHCNTGLGMFDENIEEMQRAIDYLKLWKVKENEEKAEI